MARKTREEMIAEANAPKGDEAKVAAEEIAGQDDVTNPPDEPISEEAKAEAERIMADTSDAAADAAYAEKREAGERAARKLEKILHGYSPTAPDEHIVFGNGADKFTLGDLRAIFAGRR